MTVGAVLEKLQKYCSLLDIICKNLDRLQRSVKSLIGSSSWDLGSINNVRVESNGQISIVPLLPTVVEHLNFLAFVLEHSSEPSSSSYASSSTQGTSSSNKLNKEQV